MVLLKATIDNGQILLIVMRIDLYLGQKNWMRDIIILKNKVVVKQFKILYYFLLKKRGIDVWVILVSSDMVIKMLVSLIILLTIILIFTIK